MAREKVGEGDLMFFGRPDDWRFRRHNARGLKYQIRRNDGHDVTPSSLLCSTVECANHDEWAFARPPNPVKDPRHPSYTRYKKGSIVVTDDGRLDAILDAAHEFDRWTVDDITDEEAAAKLRGTPDGMWLRDCGEVSTLTVLNGTMGDWFISQQGGMGDPFIGHPDVKERLTAIMLHVARTYRLGLDKALAHNDGTLHIKPPPATRNCGFPWFGRHPLLKVGSSLKGGNALLLEEHGLEQCALLGYDKQCANAAGVASRSGPLVKPRPLRRFTGSRWVERGTSTGASQRDRVVQMADSSTSQELEQGFAKQHEARRHIRGLWHTGTQDADMIRGFKYVWEGDISGYDRHMRRVLQEMWAAALLAAGVFDRRDHDAYLYCETLPLITPHWGLSGELVTVARFVGGTRSGLRHTAESGTGIAVSVSLLAFQDQGFDVTRWPNTDEFALLHQGDDVLLAANREVNREDWRASYASCGFDCKLITGDVFLSRHQCAAKPAPRMGRIIQQTLFNESEAVGPFDLVVGLHILGLTARSEGIEAWSDKMRAAVWKVIERAEWIETLGRKYGAPCNTFTAFLSWCRSSPVAQGFVKASLEWRSGVTWLERVARDAEHSPVAQNVMRLLANSGQAALSGVTATDGQVDKCVKAIRRWPWDRRRELIEDIHEFRRAPRSDMDERWARLCIEVLGENPTAWDDEPLTAEEKEETEVRKGRSPATPPPDAQNVKEADKEDDDDD